MIWIFYHLFCLLGPPKYCVQTFQIPSESHLEATGSWGAGQWSFIEIFIVIEWVRFVTLASLSRDQKYKGCYGRRHTASAKWLVLNHQVLVSELQIMILKPSSLSVACAELIGLSNKARWETFHIILTVAQLLLESSCSLVSFRRQNCLVKWRKSTNNHQSDHSDQLLFATQMFLAV